MENKNILILVNENKDYHLQMTGEVIDYLLEKGVTLYGEENLAAKHEKINLFEHQNIWFAVVIGGDGTMMGYAQKYKELHLDVFGISAGRVGCIYDATMKNYKEKLDLIFKGEYFVEKRNSLKCILTFENGDKIEATSFNEVTLSRGNFPKLLQINLAINGMHNTPFFADGVLVATTTGSTAYNLSCGGPLLLPDSKNLVITPICPQSRLVTSLIVSDSDEIDINLCRMKIDKVNTNSRPVVFIDGHKRYEVNEKCLLQLRNSGYTLNIIRTDRQSSLYDPIIKVSQASNKPINV